jgi:methionyl-tRNA formyltransferase
MNRKIIFMGTPAFAVAGLDALVKAGHEVVAVVTAPDRPAGRGRHLKASEVKERALELGLPVLQPEKLKDPIFLAELDRIDASLYVVVAFRMLPEVVWKKPALGTINLHGSLLPAYRGAAPINWAVINGERMTGVTTFKIQQEIDTGDILLKQEIPIRDDETAGELHDRMMVIGADLMVRTVDGLFNGSLHAVPQKWDQQSVPPAAPKITPATCQIDLHRNMKTVHDLVRGMSPYPGAWCRLLENGRDVHFKILRTSISELKATAAPGTVKIDGDAMFFRCADGWLQALEVQPEGKRRMTAGELLRGRLVSNDARLIGKEGS